MRKCWILACCVGLLFMTGCKDPKKDGDPKGTGKPAASEHSHGAGPHDGALADWGGGAYHVEFAPDHPTKTATVYIIGDPTKRPIDFVPIKADKLKVVINEPKTEIELIAEPQAGETGGKSSKFVGKHDTIGIVREFSGTITGVVDGTPYTGDFKEEAH